MIRRSLLPEFTQIPNAWLRDPRTSLATKGLLAQLFSQQPGGRVSIASLAQANGVGRDAIRICVKQMQECGYLAVEQGRTQRGRFSDVDYELVDPFVAKPLQ